MSSGTDRRTEREVPALSAGAVPAPRVPRFRALRRFTLLLGALLVLDLTRAPERQLSARALLAGIDAYQSRLSPWLGRAGVRCRFEPSCSHYAEGAIQKHGALGGTARAVWRVLRCGPWTDRGTEDPP